ncbi:hypothetical protein B0H66DRAFT_634569 [Apodospora peruviana]|uniref:Uncharacterized protein n=1 Tax=Apodospora peruviana TaxID=516989 RepID=A0AAE0IQT9_9PEZI|nr:hypothetical protein B0H66DRAFT_634569 [Apodospora peruviana]
MWSHVKVLTATSLLPILSYSFLPSASCGITYSLLVILNLVSFQMPNILGYLGSGAQIYLRLPLGAPAHVVGRGHPRLAEAAEFVIWMGMLMIYMLLEGWMGLSVDMTENPGEMVSRQQGLSKGRLCLAIEVSFAGEVLIRAGDGNGRDEKAKTVVADWLWRFTTRRVYWWRWLAKEKVDEEYYGGYYTEMAVSGDYFHRLWSRSVHKWVRILEGVLVVLQVVAQYRMLVEM